MSENLIKLEAEIGFDTIPFEAVEKLIDAELAKILKIAEVYANWYWETSKQYREEDNVYARFGTRVRIVNGAFQAVWFTNTFYKDKNGVGKTRSTQLNKGRGFKYPKSAFKTALDWEKDLISMTEKNYAKLRERYSYLSKIKQAYKVYSNNLERLKI